MEVNGEKNKGKTRINYGKCIVIKKQNDAKSGTRTHDKNWTVYKILEVYPNGAVITTKYSVENTVQ